MNKNPVKVLVQVAISSFSGYGNDGLGLINALEQAGCDVYLKPAHIDPPLPQNIANMLTKRLSANPPFDLLIDHQDPGAMGISEDARRATRVAVGITMWEYCVDPLTEIFTKRGWLKWDEVRVGDSTLSINPETSLSEWVQIEDLFKSQHGDRKMLSLNSQLHNSLTTLNHKWLAKTNHGTWTWTTSEELNTNHHIPRSAARGDTPTTKTHRDEKVELLAWAYTEGWLERGKSLRIGQCSVANPGKVKRIRLALERLFGEAVRRNNPHGGVSWSEHTKKNGFTTFSLSREASAFILAEAEGKNPTMDFLTSLTLDQLDLFIYVSCIADGYATGEGRYRFAQNAGPLLDTFTNACVLAGRAITPPTGELKCKIVAVSPSGMTYTAPIVAATKIGAKATAEIVDFTGVVWCPTVKNHNWLARRNGSIFFTGNSSFDNLQGKDRKTLRKRIKEMDLFLGYDPVSTECLREYLPKRGKAPTLGTLQGGFDSSLWKYVDRDWNSDTFSFCMVGALHQRKEPFLSIQAFKELKDEKGEDFAGARLNLKTNIPGLHSEMEHWCPGLKIYYDVWPTETLRSFYADQHMLLAPSRGEGKHLPALEFQSTGGVVAATNWGGPTMWLNSEYSFPIKYELAPISGGMPNCKNARASKEHLKEIMWYAYTHRSEMREMGNTAASIIPVSHSWDSVVDRLFNKVGDLPGDGEAVYNKYLLGKPREEDE